MNYLLTVTSASGSLAKAHFDPELHTQFILVIQFLKFFITHQVISEHLVKINW
jgi:hypothetical protein